MGKRRRAPGGGKRNPAVLGSVLAVVVAGAGFGGYSLLSGGQDDGHSGSSTAQRQVKKGPPTTVEIRRASHGFLTAWQKGDRAKAAKYTDDAGAARAALAGYTKDAHLTDVKVVPGKARGAEVPYSVTATVAYKGKRKPFAYSSALTVVRRAEDGRPLVGWHPSVVHPDLKQGETLRTGEAGTPPIRAVDRDGAELTARAHPSLAAVLDDLRDRFGEKAGGTAGAELYIARKGSKEAGKGGGAGDDAKSGAASDTRSGSDSGGGDGEGPDPRPGKTLLKLSDGTPGRLRTTISAPVQAAAEKQAAKSPRTSIVSVKPSTGEVLGFANSAPGGFNTALQGSIAPGSTMKIVTGSLLLEKGLAGYDKPHPCPKYASYGGWKFQNVEKFQIKSGTFRDSFGASCNTAFITQAKKLGDDDLTKQAQEVFGLGRDNWSIGVPTFDGAVPVQRDAAKAASLIGQGGVRMNPLNMASVIATAKTGTFRQPYLVAPSVDGRTLAKAPRALSGSAQRQLRRLLTYTATSGSGAEPMAGLGSDIGAKTGSAEVDNQKKPNGWFTAWHGDTAAAAVVQQGGRGGASAGPVVRAVLLAGG
ncbi:penicillin-binding transpeptidase domain-containing protein [Streptomyces tsukubensis]|uniref:Penicillin-binding protein n=1 Tax=Streptomyces tsukubensis TaxID=83656 RepID=A0A1V4A5X2_9ACTN|nr:penicillin-binding protein [Streptomyces tsukubensis]